MWRQLAITVDETSAEPVSDLLSSLGAVSVSFEDAGDQPLFEPKPGETPVWRQTKVIGLFDAEADTDRTAQRLIAMGITRLDRFTYRTNNNK